MKKLFDETSVDEPSVDEPLVDKPSFAEPSFDKPTFDEKTWYPSLTCPLVAQGNGRRNCLKSKRSGF
jgi:hypothetical protein